ncbi:Hypothetical predicted protein [Cloeon dipterum]|uniref:Uncharacterized protein n=1 Tax=Cloeon dipterum TaxID=197152 RepID=A0A8S1C487_9INSE|nr:Hypothetical predicted protein [Cloeon dipterum]
MSKAVRKLCFGQESQGQVEPWIVHSLVNHLGISPDEFTHLQEVAAIFIDTFYADQRESLDRLACFGDRKSSGRTNTPSDLITCWSSLNFRRSQTGKC